MTLRYRSLALLCLLSTACSSTDGQTPSVTFYPVENHGEHAEAIVESLTNPSGKEFVNQCKGDTCYGIPIDGYSYRLKLKVNGRLVTGKSLIGQSPIEWLTVPLGPSIGTAGDFEGHTLQGQIDQLPRRSGQRAWVRLQGLYSNMVLEAPVSSAGAFRFDHVLDGKWILLVLDGDEVLHNEVLNYRGFPNAPPLRIVVKK